MSANDKLLDQARNIMGDIGRPPWYIGVTTTLYEELLLEHGIDPQGTPPQQIHVSLQGIGIVEVFVKPTQRL